MIAKSVDSAGVKVKREVRYQWELKDPILDAVFAATSQREFNQIVEKVVFSDPRYERLAKHRQMCLEWYALGAMHAQAKMMGISAPEHAAPRSTVRARKKSNGKSKQPKRKRQEAPPPPVHVETYGPRLWATETILAPEYRSPFPIASDLPMAVSHG